MRAADNPFRASRVDALAFRAPGFDWSALLAGLDRVEGKGAIRGPCGSGKSTLLRDLAVRLAARGMSVRALRPDPDDPTKARRQVAGFTKGIAPDTALLLDGADRLSHFAWRRLSRATRSAAVLVVTTHRGGRLPTLFRCEPSAEILGGLLIELEGAVERREAERLFSLSGGDLRTALRISYNRAAGAGPKRSSQVTRAARALNV